MKRAENQPTSSLTIYGGCFVKAYSVKDAGTLLPQHSHRHAHLTALTAGRIRAWADGTIMGDFVAPALLKIAAGVKHSFLTLTDDVGLMCIHAVGAAEADEGDLVHEEHQLEMEG